ncbi:MAG: alanine--glyoxylate aminotransferase family protein [Ruminococcaceae bacterium]|nr:alanine--glyoxylate aminotransferase family protein [Oscillospiraceae bacterium]
MKDKTLVMIPGPTPVSRPIQEQMGREIQAFGDPRFVADYKSVIDDLGELFGCDGKTFVIAGTGTLAMEMAISNVTKRGDSILIVSHGYFGDRFTDIATHKGLDIDVLSAEWGQIVPVEVIRAKLASKKYAAMTVTHVDTATGVCAPIAEIGEMMKEFPETIYIVDGVAATAGEYANLAEMNIDMMFTASQKAFGVCPGLFLLWANQKVLARRKELGIIPEYYVDFDKWIPIMDDPSKYFATPAINLVWALKESVRQIKEEGLKARYDRHVKNARAMQKALEALGFRILATPEHRAVTLSNLIYPEGLNDMDFRMTLLDEGIVVAGGLAAYAGRMFRLGHMGNIDINDEVTVLGVIERALNRCGVKVPYGSGVAVYTEEMSK